MRATSDQHVCTNQITWPIRKLMFRWAYRAYYMALALIIVPVLGWILITLVVALWRILDAVNRFAWG